jgi:hypothetical protein
MSLFIVNIAALEGFDVPKIQKSHGHKLAVCKIFEHSLSPAWHLVGPAFYR